MSNANMTLTGPLTVRTPKLAPIPGDDRDMVYIDATTNFSVGLYGTPEELMELGEQLVAIALDRDKLLVPTWARELADLAAQMDGAGR